MPTTIKSVTLRFITPTTSRRIGRTLIVVGILLIVATVLLERINWWQQVSEDTQRYFWQRSAFVVAINVDFPMVQLVITGTVMLFRNDCNTEHLEEVERGHTSARV